MSEGQEPFAPRHRRTDKRRIGWGAAVCVWLCCLVLGGLSGFLGVQQFLNSRPLASEATLHNEAQDPEQEQTEAVGQLTFLAIGCDERNPDEKARADTIMLIRLDGTHQAWHVLSIPRDTYVRIPGYREKTKINHALAYGGVDLLTKTVEEYLGVDIDHFVKVNFEGVIKSIDLIGGVEVNVEERMYKPLEGIDLMPGQQRLDGEQALAFVRYRNKNTADIGRIGRQQEFLVALLEQVKTMKLADYLKVGGELYKEIESDMTLGEMLQLAKACQDIGSWQQGFWTLEGEGEFIGAINYYIVPDSEVRDKVAQWQDMSDEPEAAAE